MPILRMDWSSNVCKIYVDNTRIIEEYQQCKLSSGKIEDVFVCKLVTICGGLGAFHLVISN